MEWWLFIVNAIVWLGLGGYLAFLGASQRNLARRVSRLELLREK